MSDATSTPIITQSPSNKLVALRLAIGLIKTVGAYVIGALMGIDWKDLSGQQQFLIVVAGVVAVATHIESFNDKTSARAEQGREARKAGDTNPPFVPPVKPSDQFAKLP